MTPAEFSAYQVLIIGDPTCGYTVSEGTEALESAETWEPVVMASGGNKVIIGTDPTFHNDGPSGTQRGDLLEANGIAYAGAVKGATGLYLDLSCSYDFSPSDTPVPILNGLSSYGSHQFTVTGEGSISACATNVNIVASTGPTAGLADANLSYWNCSVHEAFDTFPADYTPLALAPSSSGFSASFCANDVDTDELTCGSPYILVSGTGIGSAGPSLGEQGGPAQLSEHRTTCSNGDPVNCATGTLNEQFTDFSVPGKGLPLELTRSYSTMDAGLDSPFGYGWTDSYDMRLAIASEAVAVQQEDGSLVGFSSNGKGGYVAPPRVLASLMQNPNGTYTFMRFAEHVQYVFSAEGRLIEEIDRNGYVTKLIYSGEQLTAVTDSSGRSLNFSYEGGHISTVTDPMGRSYTYGYDGAGNLVRVTDPLGRTETFTYGSNHELLTSTDPQGGTTVNVYNEAGQVVKQTDPAGRATTWAFNGDPASAAGSTTTITDPRGKVTEEQYKNLELIAVTHAAGTPEAATTSYEYDPKTLGITKVTDPDGDETTYTYDAEGNLRSQTDPLGRRTTFSYNNFGEVTSETDPEGTTTTYSYDGNGNLLERATPLTATGEVVRTTYKHEAEPGEVTAVTNPDGDTTTYVYDNNGDRTSETNPEGTTTTYTYNAAGELTSKVAPAGNAPGGDSTAHTTSYTYDDDGELTKEVGPEGQATSYTYDGDGNRTSVTNADGQTTHETYNADNEVTEVARPDGSVLKTEWDADGNMVAQINAAGHKTSYGYNALNELTSMTDADGQTTTYSYDPAGRETELTNPEGETTYYGYDADDELTSIDYSDGTTPDVSESYDADGNRIELDDGSGQSIFTYDSLNRMTSATNGNGATVNYDYDLAGNLAGLTYPNGKTVTRGYNAAGELTSVTDWLGNTTHFSYSPDATMTGETYPNGIAAAYSYDNADRLTSITDARGGSTLASFNYARDALGQVTSEEATNGGATATTKYGYDSLAQLTSAGEALYSYDAADDPTTFGPDTTQIFDAANELTTSTSPSTATEIPQEAPSKKSPEEGGQTPSSPSSPSTGGTAKEAAKRSGTANGRAAVKSVKIDAMASAKTLAGRKLTSKSIKTNGKHDLLVALIGSVGTKAGQRVVGLSGDKLHWKRVTKDDHGDSAIEVWQARARGRVKGPVMARLRRPADAAMTVVAFSGPASVETHVISSGQKSTPRSPLQTTDGGSLWAVGTGTGTSRIRPANGQQIVTQVSNKGHHTATWIQRPVTGQPTAQIVDRGKAGNWAMAAIAIGNRSAQTAKMGRFRRSKHQARQAASPKSATSNGGIGAGSREAGARAGVPATSVSSAAASTEVVTHTFSYNARGDRVREEAPGSKPLVLTYDQADRLVGVGSDIRYGYNGDGLRMSKTVDGTTTQFVWNETETTPELLQSGSTYYVYGPEGQPIEQITGEVPTYRHQDQQGSTRLLTNVSGEVTGRYDYNAWGAVTSHTGTATTALQYDGQYTDAKTGYQYLRARYYDPATGQFLTVDPAIVVSRSPYGFVGMNPIGTYDPLGLWGWNPISDITQAASDTGSFVGQHWRGIAQGVVIGAGAVGATACVVATAGICGGVIGTIATVGAIGGATGSAVYGLSSGPHTVTGYAESFGLGGVGAVATLFGGPVYKAIVGGTLSAFTYELDSGSCGTSFGGLLGSVLQGIAEGALPNGLLGAK